MKKKTTAKQSQENKKTKVEPGRRESALRWKRRLRLTSIISIVVVLIIISLFFYLQSSAFEEWFKGILIQNLEEYLGRDVSIRSVSVELPRITVTLEDFVIAGFDNDERPFLRIKKASLYFSFFAIFNRELRFKSAVLEQPEISIVLTKDGKINLPLFPGSEEEEEGFFRLVLDNFQLKEGILYFNNRIIPASGTIDDFETNIKYDAVNSSYQGEVAFQTGIASFAGYEGFRSSLKSSFIFLPNRLIFPEVRFRFSGADILSSGVVYDFESLKYNFDYRGTWDLELLSEVLELPVSLSGRGILQGVFKSSPDGRVGDGTLSIPETPIGPFNVRNLKSHYYFTEDIVQLTEIKAETFLGNVSGGFVLNSANEKSDYYLQIKGEKLALADILKGFGYSGLGLISDLNLDGEFAWVEGEPDSINGKMELVLVEDPGIKTEFINFINGYNTNSGYRPVGDDPVLTKPMSFAGKAKLIINNSKWQLNTSDISLPLTRFVFHGSGYGFDSAVEEVKIESHDIKELDIFQLRLVRILDGWRPTENYWPPDEMPPPLVGLSGAANFRGQIIIENGELNRIFGNASGKRIWAHNTFFDEGGALIDFRDNHLKFEKGWSKKEDCTTKFSGEIHLFEDAPEGINKLVVNAEFEKLPAEDVLDLFFYPEDLDGKTDGNFALTIDHRGNIDGDLDIKIRDGRFFKDTFEKAEVLLHFDKDWLNFKKLLVTKGLQKADFKLKMNLEESGYSIDGNLENVFLHEIKSLKIDRSPFMGRISASIKGEGLLYKPTFEMLGSIEESSFLGKELGEIDFASDGENGRIEFDAIFSKDTTNLRLRGQMNNDYSFSAEGEVDDLSIYKLMPYTGGIVDRVFRGVTSGRVKMEGNFRDIGNIHVRGVLTELALTIHNYYISLAENAEFEIHDFIVNLDKLKMTDGRGVFSAEGTIGLSRRFPSNVKFDYNLDLSEVVAVFENIVLDGFFKGEGYFRGFVLDPYWGGEGTFRAATFKYPGMPEPIEEIEGDMEFTQNTISLENFNGVWGDGDMTCTGQMTFTNSKPDKLLFRFNGENANLELAPGVNAIFGGAVNVTGEWSNKKLTGNIDLARFRYTNRFDPEEFILGRMGKGSAGYKAKTSFFDTMELDLAVKADDNVVINNNFAQVELSTDIRLTGRASGPIILGRMEVLNGLVFYRDKTFNVLNASVDNFNNAEFDPVIDFRARTKVRNYVIYLTINGTKDKIYPTVSSEPSLPTIDIINLLALGKPRSNIYERSEETVLSVGVSPIISQSLVGGLEQGAAELFGFDRFRIDPFLISSLADPTARLTVGKRITSDLNIIYSTNIASDQQDVLIIEYRLGPKTLVVASRDEYGAYGVEIQFEAKY